MSPNDDAAFLCSIGITAGPLFQLPKSLALFERPSLARYFRVVKAEKAGAVVCVVADGRTIQGFGVEVGRFFHARLTSRPEVGDLVLLESHGAAWVGEFRGRGPRGTLVFLSDGAHQLPAAPLTIHAVLTKDDSWIDALQVGDEIIYRNRPAPPFAAEEITHRATIVKITSHALSLASIGPKGGKVVRRIRRFLLRSGAVIVMRVVSRTETDFWDRAFAEVTA